MKTIRAIFASFFLVISLIGCTTIHQNRDILFQVSTLDALMVGVYDGDLTFGELKEHGDFGLGTFNALDGEMIGINGDFYQIKTDGVAYLVDDTMTTPFSAVTFFDADILVAANEGWALDQLEQYIDGLLPTKNIFYAIKIKGTFDYIKTRSVPRQEKPYPDLPSVIKEQTIFEFTDVSGTIVGFWCPAFVSGINVSGFHFHFITADRSTGGHLLDLKLKDATIEIDYTDNFYLLFPDNPDFYESVLGADMEEGPGNLE